MLFSLLGIIILIIAIFIYLGNLQQQSFLETAINEEKNIAKRIYLQTFSNFVSKYELIAKNILANKEVISAFETKDRNKLLELTQNTYNQLQNENKYLQIFHFHTPQTHSFLRVHKPEKFGDDLSSIRHMINRVNKLHIKQIGLEVGRYGIHYRVALPVFNQQREFLGTFELGINFNYILDTFKNIYGFDSILLFKKDIFDIIFSQAEDFTYSEYSKDFYEVHHQFTSETNSSEETTTFKVNVITDSTTRIIGRIMFKKNFDYYTKDIKNIYNNFIGLAIFLILLFFFLIERLFGKYFQTIENYQKELNEKQNKLIKASNTDFLTKLNNRKSTDSILHDEIVRSRRYNHALSVVLFDIDNFKLINDNHGHNIGDTVLKTLANLVSSSIRKTDHLGRWGGEEFILILPETPLDVGYELTEKIRKIIFEHDFDGLRVTCSFGITEYLCQDTFETIVHNADTALYESKHNGKNIVTIFKD